jgi:hypothetical protein
MISNQHIRINQPRTGTPTPALTIQGHELCDSLYSGQNRPITWLDTGNQLIVDTFALAEPAQPATTA